MQLPKQIYPNPLVTSTVELRFDINIEQSLMFSKVYPAFLADLPNFEESKIPKEIKNSQENFKFTPDYILKNNDFSLSFSDKAIAFENVSEYKFWDVYFPFIEKQLKVFLDLGIVNNITRIGVRYASIFDTKNNITQVLKNVPQIPIIDYQQEFGFMRIDLKRKEYDFHVQIASKAVAVKNGKTLTGTYVDIDSSLNKTQANINCNEVIKIIDELHTAGKILFFKEIISEAFLKTLNPQY